MRIDKRIVLVLLGTSLVLIGVYIQPIFEQVRIMVFMNIIPLDLVFDEGINLKEYDGAVILNCLHGGGCPEGVKFKNDETGQIEEREIVPKTAQPYVPPEDPNAPPDPRTFADLPTNVQQTVIKLDMVSYVIIGVIVGGLVIAFVYLLISKRRKVKIT